MLPVQTVMIRYMVLVYRWGRGRSDAVSVWGGSVTGGCARGGGYSGGALAEGAKRPRRCGTGGAFALGK